MSVHVYVYMPTHEWRPEEDVRCPLSLSTYSFEAGSRPEPGACIFVRLEASQLHSPVSVHIAAEVCRDTHLVTWVLGSDFQHS